MQQQLASLTTQDKSIQGVNVEIAGNDIRRYQAAVDEASAKAHSANLDYQRYRQLMTEGAISKQKVDQLEAVWKSTEAEVAQAIAILDSAKTSHNVLKGGTALKGDSLLNQRVSLTQTIQAQATLVKTLTAQLTSNTSLRSKA